MTRPTITVRAIIAIVAADYGLSFARVVSGSRVPVVAEARAVAMFLARRHLPSSFPHLHAQFLTADHTTVFSAVQRIVQRAVDDADLAARLERLGHRINAAEALALVEVTAIERALGAASPPERSEPAILIPQGATSIVDVVARYLGARERLNADRYSCSEAAARRDADRAFEALKLAYIALTGQFRSAA